MPFATFPVHIRTQPMAITDGRTGIVRAQRRVPYRHAGKAAPMRPETDAQPYNPWQIPRYPTAA